MQKLWINTAAELRGGSRRGYMAETVRLLGVGGQRFAERVLGWSRKTIRKGAREQHHGVEPDRLSERGRRRAEERLPNLLEDIRGVVDPDSQTDPSFRSTRVYTRLTAAEVRRRLEREKGYPQSELPSERTLRTKLNELGYELKRVRKCRPLKKVPETDGIFEQVHRVNDEADAQTVRISLDTKAVVKVGDFSRGGEHRCEQKALDHDFAATSTLTPFGVLVPKSGQSHLWFTPGPATADFMVDCLQELWPRLQSEQEVKTLVINADNGPESNGQRTQWLKRLVQFSDQHQVTVQLAYYPPYHSKYNPVERLWGVLENHWRGELLSTVEKVLGMAQSMTYRQLRPTVRRVKRVYAKGIRLTKKLMRDVEARLDRHAELGKWFITIRPQPEAG